jgi:hypothetical protein
MTTKVSRTFVNWSENLINENATIYYPIHDEDIISIIEESKRKGAIVRVVGSGHSMSPLVADSKERVNLISLRDYQLSPENVTIDTERLTVTVNAGWTLGRLYDHLNPHSYFLETQPASTAFTLGGLVAAPVHGGRLGASFVGDGVLAITFINFQGERITKTYLDQDFEDYRINLGIYGVVISVTLKLQKIEFLKLRTQVYRNVFLDSGKVNRDVVGDKFISLIRACYSSEVKYHHGFLDFHNNQLLTIDWEATNEKGPIYLDTPEENEVNKIGLIEAFHKYLFPNYRENENYLKILGKIFTTGIVLSTKKNSLEDHDMFWVSLGTRVFYLSYLIPVHFEEESDIFLDRLCHALEVVREQVTISLRRRKKFNIDFPLDIRFVCSSSLASASPIASSKKTVYMAVDLMCSAVNLDLNSTPSRNPLDWLLPSRRERRKRNEDFREFFSSVEQQWIRQGAVPHYAKMFGLNVSSGIPFDLNYVRSILPEETKRRLRAKGHPLFMNTFINQMLS